MLGFGAGWGHYTTVMERCQEGVFRRFAATALSLMKKYIGLDFCGGMVYNGSSYY